MNYWAGQKAINIANIRDDIEEKEKKYLIQGTSNRIQCMHLSDKTFNKELKIQIFLQECLCTYLTKVIWEKYVSDNESRISGLLVYTPVCFVEGIAEWVFLYVSGPVSQRSLSLPGDNSET